MSQYKVNKTLSGGVHECTETDGVINMLKSLVRVNALHFLDPTRIFDLTHGVGNSVIGKLRMRKLNTKSAVPLDVAPKLRTQRCSPRFWPGGRFWSQVSDTCRQAGRERNVGP